LNITLNPNKRSLDTYIVIKYSFGRTMGAFSFVFLQPSTKLPRREKGLNITAPNRVAALSYVSLESYRECSTRGWGRAIGRNFSVVCFAALAYGRHRRARREEEESCSRGISG